jgi:hypothetical protein
MLDRNVVWLAVGVDHLEVEHLDVGTAHVQPDRLEAALAAPDPDRIAVLAEERNILAAQLDPVATTAADNRRGLQFPSILPAEANEIVMGPTWEARKGR